MSSLIDRPDYATQYGPTTGDRVHLADTGLVAKIEANLTTYGDELVFGGGKTIRDGMGMVSRFKRSDGALDFVITNAVLIDPLLGIVVKSLAAAIESALQLHELCEAQDPDTRLRLTPILKTLPVAIWLAAPRKVRAVAGRVARVG